MLRVLATVAVAAIGGTTLAYAQNLDIIKQRRETMRAVAGASTPVFRMTKGDIPFDLAAVQGHLKTMQDNVEKMRTLFPDDSKTGGDTDASPRIWTARAEFNAAIDKWHAETKAVAAKITDEASFKANYPGYGGACGLCHKANDGFAPSLSESFKKPRP